MEVKKLTREEHTAKIQEIKQKINDVDDGTITNILADLSDDYLSILANIDETNLQNEKLKNDNENLRDTNMRLFLRVGAPNSEASAEAEAQQVDKLTYENLFTATGELK